MPKLFYILAALLLSGCLTKQGSPISSYDNDVNEIQSGDIIVANTGNDTIIQLDRNGNYKNVLVDSQTDPNINFAGLIYDTLTSSLLFIYDHTTASLDAIRKISLYDASVSTYLSNSNVSATSLPGLARMTSGDLLILKTTTSAEKFSSALARIGAPFIATLTNPVIDVAPLANGGFVVCSSATALTVRLYTAAGVAGNSATSAAPGTSLGALASSSCIEDASGNIIVAYTSAIRSYNSTLLSVNWTYQDTNNLSNAGKLAIRSNGNILVTDRTFNHIVELNSSGGLVQLIGGAVLSTPWSIAVVP